ncbi:DUF1508 domain-containing protein [Chitinophaga sp. SYP-B3965]|uniref:YegP family protein n=1 Tax=Chitinophaga sp. SYP-B3965 TaxID=2663120 RepID=UPI001299688C|nr:YegP family protein [Chitinophaga sp. SYP-B3965]MRG47657.1 DUF1508 domain-containing protein [Chitinophaga sp. SYP-B3965]
MATFVISQSSDGQFRFTLKATNGETILNSETYTAKANCLGGVESVRDNSQLDERYEKKNAADGKPYFVLLAANRQPIGTSETYDSTSNRDAGIASVKKNAPDADTDDQTA